MKAMLWLLIVFLSLVSVENLAIGATDRAEPSFVSIEEEAAKGDPAAQYTLAQMYHKGEGVEADSQKAAAWYTKAAENGYANAQYVLGMMYSTGDGMPVDKVKATQLISESAEQGFAWAQLGLAEMYAKGEGVTVDRIKALHWYEKAANNNNPKALFILGLSHEDRRNYDLYNRAAKEGYFIEQYTRDLIIDGVKADNIIALKYYKIAAENGFATAQFYLGWMYYNGTGTEKNERDAFRWWSEAAKQGHEGAEVNMNILCRTISWACKENLSPEVKTWTGFKGRKKDEIFSEKARNDLKIQSPVVNVNSERKNLPAQYIDQTTEMEFVLVDSGCFNMGNTTSGSFDETPMHEVCLDSFYIGKFEVTQIQYKRIMGSNPAHFSINESNPVENVSYEDALRFIFELNNKSRKNYRLPTEAEWEYSASAGESNTKFSNGNDAVEVSWLLDNANGTTHKVGEKMPNAFGLFDMIGNVWEWCSDWYSADYYKNSNNNNPKGPDFGTGRVNRGGGWDTKSKSMLIFDREGYAPNRKNSNLGFRLVLPASKN